MVDNNDAISSFMLLNEACLESEFKNLPKAEQTRELVDAEFAVCVNIFPLIRKDLLTESICIRAIEYDCEAYLQYVPYILRTENLCQALIEIAPYMIEELSHEQRTAQVVLVAMRDNIDYVRCMTTRDKAPLLDKEAINSYLLVLKRFWEGMKMRKDDIPSVPAINAIRYQWVNVMHTELKELIEHDTSQLSAAWFESVYELRDMLTDLSDDEDRLGRINDFLVTLDRRAHHEADYPTRASHKEDHPIITI